MLLKQDYISLQAKSPTVIPLGRRDRLSFPTLGLLGGMGVRRRSKILDALMPRLFRMGSGWQRFL